MEKEINPKAMITDYKEIQHLALELDENHRAELAKQLIYSLDPRVDDDIEQAWIDEVKRRKAEIKSGKVTPISGQEVHKAARELLKK
ncbi:addiction module protein [Gracilimonas sp. BCB1]|uniref:addiction module protein n=1 Tax=Gracilimonas sp. BCB1 TaxID=3152362 RepID=UPI0032D94A9B